MSTFVRDLVNSIFTPGPTPALLVATNAAFGALQLLLGILLVATRSVHFVVLSVLTGGLWWAINWFARELQATETVKQEGQQSTEREPRQDDGGEQSGDDTETEGQTPIRSRPLDRQGLTYLAPGTTEALRRRRSPGDGGGEVSTEDEWEKVSEAGTNDR